MQLFAEENGSSSDTFKKGGLQRIRLDENFGKTFFLEKNSANIDFMTSQSTGISPPPHTNSVGALACRDNCASSHDFTKGSNIRYVLTSNF